MKTTVILPLAFIASGANAWGTLGHQSVALLAQQYLLPGTIQSVQTLLNDTTTTYLGDIALWADSFRYTPEGSFSGGYHFVNGHDAPPPESCEIIYPEDCPPEGCVIKAIGNYTERLKDYTLPVDQRQQALKFVVHFIGDISQPLHTEAFGAGANNLTVWFQGYKTNLHAAWDTAIPNAMIGFPPNAKIGNGDSLGWANNLAAAINAGKYKKLVWSWLKDHSVRSLKEEERAATVWAQESNEEVCDYAMVKGGNAYNGTEIGGAYYEGAKPIVEVSIAKAGIRLAAWLNLIFEGKTGFEVWSIGQTGQGQGKGWNNHDNDQ
ncbi:S1/P1 nuclease [Pyronema omphalodes]|nr:S1/P1 nuclease [Pyronema omphalodes]